MQDSQPPLVSVCIQTYQHAAYIRECLDSVITQQTDFPFEIIIGEDDSTDGTREICISYSRQYPGLIRLFLRSEQDKIYINGEKTGRYNLIHNLKAAKGKYIALLDGDDYWPDKLKLQQQAAFLEQHPDYSICFCGVQILRENKFYTHRVAKRNKKVFTAAHLAADCFIQPCSIMFRNPGFAVLPDYYWKLPVLDYCLFLKAAEEGKIFYLDKPMAVYRQHAGGLWLGSNRERQLTRLWNFLDIIIPHSAESIRGILTKQRNFRIKQLIKWYVKSGQNEKLAQLPAILNNQQPPPGIKFLKTYIIINRLRYSLKKAFTYKKSRD